jgi:hypothetical protein
VKGYVHFNLQGNFLENIKGITKIEKISLLNILQKWEVYLSKMIMHEIIKNVIYIMFQIL